ncbi:MAG: phosphopantetheine-binding protein [Candidatus Nanopelagicales bacterium]|jgi:acyl carrier protein|nr:phosphopantetheine-binding protein [Candidatus Nanopelagicales bacterium]
MADTQSTVIRILAEMTGLDAAQINETTRLAEDLHIKSVNRMELTVRIDDELGAKLTVFDILKAKTVADVVALSARQPAGAS